MRRFAAGSGGSGPPQKAFPTRRLLRDEALRQTADGHFRCGQRAACSQPVDGRDRGDDPTVRRPPSAVPADAPGLQGKTLHTAEISNDEGCARRTRTASARGGKISRGRDAAAATEPGRIAAVVERPARRDEPGRPKAAADAIHGAL